MKRTVLALLLACFLSFVSLSFAEEVDFWFEDEDEEAIFYLTLPDGWNGEWQEEDGLSLLHVLPDDESVYLSVWAVHDVEDLEDAAEAIDELLDSLVTDLKPEEWSEMSINEIPFLYSEASAKLKEDETLVDLSVAFFVPEEEYVFVILYFGTPEAWHEHKEDVEMIYESIRTEEE